MSMTPQKAHIVSLGVRNILLFMKFDARVTRELDVENKQPPITINTNDDYLTIITFTMSYQRNFTH